MRVFKNCRLFDPHTDEILEDVCFSVTTQEEGVDNGRIVELYCDGETREFEGSVAEEVDLHGKIIIPGFIDAHMHIESTLLPPQRTRFIAERGTVACIADPHEITNVLGVEGFELFLEDSEHATVDYKFAIPSCVPATPFETAGGDMDASAVADIIEKDRDRARKIEMKSRFYARAERVAGLAEVMNVPGVLDKEFVKLQDILRVSRAAQIHIDGHAPAVSLPWLNRYIAAGIHTDHECTTGDELRERIRRGMTVLIRGGTACHNVEALCTALSKMSRVSTNRCAFCTDDRRIDDIVESGHIDAAVRLGIKCGLDPRDSIRMATLNAANMFGLGCDYGAVAPGRYASFIVLNGDMESLEIESVFVKGKRLTEIAESTTPVRRLNAMNVDVNMFRKKLTEAVFKGPAIGVIPNQITTTQEEANSDSLMMIVVDRYSGTCGMGCCFINGITLGPDAAIASTVAHDSHNIVCVGNTRSAMDRAVTSIVESGGGYVCISGSAASLVPLPIAGLITDEPCDQLIQRLHGFRESLERAGCSTNFDVMMTISFMALPVIPKLKLTDKGLFDAGTFKFLQS